MLYSTNNIDDLLVLYSLTESCLSDDKAPNLVVEALPLGLIQLISYKQAPLTHCHRIGTPFSSLAGGLAAPPFSGLFRLLTGLITLDSSTLVSRCRKLLSFTGLPLDAPWRPPTFVGRLVPLLPLLGPGEVRCGMFSGSGC